MLFYCLGVFFIMFDRIFLSPKEGYGLVGECHGEIKLGGLFLFYVHVLDWDVKKLAGLL